jgi:hypothetical protein
LYQVALNKYHAQTDADERTYEVGDWSPEPGGAGEEVEATRCPS